MSDNSLEALNEYNTASYRRRREKDDDSIIYDSELESLSSIQSKLSITSQSLKAPQSKSIQSPKNMSSVKTPQKESIFKNINLESNIPETIDLQNKQLQHRMKDNNFTIESFGKLETRVKKSFKSQNMNFELEEFQEDIREFLSKNEEFQLSKSQEETLKSKSSKNKGITKKVQYQKRDIFQVPHNLSELSSDPLNSFSKSNPSKDISSNRSKNISYRSKKISSLSKGLSLHSKGMSSLSKEKATETSEFTDEGFQWGGIEELSEHNLEHSSSSKFDLSSKKKMEKKTKSGSLRHQNSENKNIFDEGFSENSEFNSNKLAIYKDAQQKEQINKPSKKNETLESFEPKADDIDLMIDNKTLSPVERSSKMITFNPKSDLIFKNKRITFQNKNRPFEDSKSNFTISVQSSRQSNQQFDRSDVDNQLEDETKKSPIVSPEIEKDLGIPRFTFKNLRNKMMNPFEMRAEVEDNNPSIQNNAISNKTYELTNSQSDFDSFRNPVGNKRDSNSKENDREFTSFRKLYNSKQSGQEFSNVSLDGKSNKKNKKELNSFKKSNIETKKIEKEKKDLDRKESSELSQDELSNFNFGSYNQDSDLSDSISLDLK